MNGLSWSALAIILVVCHMTIAAPSPLRVKRQDELSLDPVSADVSRNDEWKSVSSLMTLIGSLIDERRCQLSKFKRCQTQSSLLKVIITIPVNIFASSKEPKHSRVSWEKLHKVQASRGYCWVTFPGHRRFGLFLVSEMQLSTASLALFSEAEQRK